ncbi:cytidine deaminase family protein [Glutamicibacter arilaitensis]|uniref:cytidine deaminase family protein n=1 Tax=Glutamicibacter arilaitensis TaxID=256701 RepID=UPI00384CC268
MREGMCFLMVVKRKAASTFYYEVMPTSLPASALPLSADEWSLVRLAGKTINATTDAGPHENGVHTMGAAVRAKDGSTFTGVNIYHFTGGPCAELVALGSARAAGATELTHIVAVGSHGRGVKSPCGRDRQIFADYYPQMRVIVETQQGMVSVLASDLLPFGYDHRAEQV